MFIMLQGVIDLALVKSSPFSKVRMSSVCAMAGLMWFSTRLCIMQASSRQCIRPHSFVFELEAGGPTSTVKMAADSKVCHFLLLLKQCGLSGWCHCGWTG